MKSVTATFILIVFVILGELGMLAITGLDKHYYEPGCPFMPSEQAICSMTALDHITAWQNSFTITLPKLFSYFLIVIAVLFVWKYYSPPDLFVRRLPLPCPEDYVLVPLYQKLFSSGILNPKSP